MDEQSKSVFFSNVPLGTSEASLREIFERAGRVTNLRLLPQTGRKYEKDSLCGFCDFADNLAAQAAVRSLSGTPLSSDKSLIVKIGEIKKKRGRDIATISEDIDEMEKQFVPSSLALPGDPIQLALCDANKR